MTAATRLNPVFPSKILSERKSGVEVGKSALGRDFFTICSGFSQRSEEGQQGIASLESGDGFAGRG
jgi:hypothetical protein